MHEDQFDVSGSTFRRRVPASRRASPGVARVLDMRLGLAWTREGLDLVASCAARAIESLGDLRCC
jgi:hypothetical protein